MIVNKNVILTYKNNRGMSVIFEHMKNYSLKSCDEDVQNNINYVRQSGVDGGIYKNDKLEPRTLTLYGVMFCGRHQNHKLAQNLLRTFNPKNEGVLTYYNKRSRETFNLKCKPARIVEIGIEGNLTSFTIELLAVDPYWHGEVVTEIIAETQKLTKFPLIVMDNFIFGQRLATLESTFDNIGDADVGFVVEFIAEQGSVLNPKVVYKATKEEIKVHYQMEKGDVIKIINYPESPKEIILNDRISLFDNIEPDKTNWFSLQAGKNTIAYMADENYSNLKVIVKYGPKYLGVG